ncbi:MAG: hypothetical protein HRU31_06320 [Rhodobacteraceae bacterium]|nr:hypothetical protein [Paracoccaceae bacterium]
MIRLAFWAMIFGAGVYFGANYQLNRITDACAEAGGSMTEADLCEVTR